MPRIFEIFGYHIEDRSEEAERCRRAARCPFMDADCDGGGNRYASHIKLTTPAHRELKEYFPNREKVPSGVCSLQLTPTGPPWIVCPRRLLVLGRSNMGRRQHQAFADALLLNYSGFKSGTKLGVWSEVKIQYAERRDEIEKYFDSTFDYIVMPIDRVPQPEIEKATGKDWEWLRRALKKSGFSITEQGGVNYVEDFPTGSPVIVEIMTSSTSGGNKDKGNTIPMAFENAILGRPHNAPSINYRQVWARMVSQLIVKSEVGMAWGGKTFWILQDTLVEYISATTALNVEGFLATAPSEVNILSFTYGMSYSHPQGVLELRSGSLFAGPIESSDTTSSASNFKDIIHASVCPPKAQLIISLIKHTPVNRISVP